MHSQSSHSIAAPGGAQDAPRPSATIQAPVSPRQGAAIERGNAHQDAGAGAPGAWGVRSLLPRCMDWRFPLNSRQKSALATR